MEEKRWVILLFSVTDREHQELRDDPANYYATLLHREFQPGGPDGESCIRLTSPPRNSTFLYCSRRSIASTQPSRSSARDSFANNVLAGLKEMIGISELGRYASRTVTTSGSFLCANALLTFLLQCYSIVVRVCLLWAQKLL